MFEIEWKIKEIVYFSSPLALNNISNLGFNHGFKILISPFISSAELGIFDLASKLSNVSYLIGSSTIKAIIPKVFKTLSKTGKIESISFYKTQLFKTSVMSSILILFTGSIVLVYFKEGQYFDSIFLLPFLLVGQSFLLSFSYYFVIFSHFRKTIYITYSLIIGSCTSLVICYILIVEFNMGLISASIGTCIGYAIQYFIGWRLKPRLKTNSSDFFS